MENQQTKPKSKPKPAKAPAQKTHLQAPRSFGPVQNMEEHVPSDWWRRIFTSLYLKTDGDVVEDSRITSQEVDLIQEALSPQKDWTILDLCCGQGRHALELARRGFKVDGFDRSHYLIRRARALAKKEGLGVRFREGDARNLNYPADQFNQVQIMGNSFGYFDSLQDDRQVLGEVYRVLKPQGRFIIDIADGSFLAAHFQPRTWEWIDNKMFVCRERSLSKDGTRLISREVITDVSKGVLADHFYAERLFRKEELIQLIEESGFEEVECFANFSPDSSRGQDLGMMENRFILVAKSTKTKPSRVARSKTKEEVVRVAVLMGDPKQPDIIKPHSKFDDDDFTTIRRMQDALDGLKGFKFEYINDHPTMVTQLLKDKSKIDLVFNLCDEGFHNMATKELHVPALLEMLGIPYSGAGPQCLAYCYDKSLTRGVAQEMGIPVPEAILVEPGDFFHELPIPFPVLVKPNAGDSSFGITQRSYARTLDELMQAISDIRQGFGYDKPILVEEFLPGKDLSYGVIGNFPGSYLSLPIIEEDYSKVPPELPRICGYEAKWLPDSPYWKVTSIQAQLAEETEKEIEAYSLKLFERLGCQDYARFDWRLNAQGKPKLLEVNPNPGWCWDGHLARMSAMVGIDYQEMLKRVLEAALNRVRELDKK